MLLLPWRFEPTATVFQQSLHQLGRPGLLRAHRWSSPTAAASNAVPIRDTLPEVDMGNWIFGEPPNHVFAQANTLPQGYCLQVHLSFRSGGMALFEYAWEPFFGEGYGSMTLIGDSGAAYQEDMHDLHLQWRGARPVAAWARPNGGGGLAALQAFADTVRDRRPVPVTLSDALAAIRVVEAMHQSLLSGTAVALPIHE